MAGSGAEGVDTSPAVFLTMAGACLGGMIVAFLAGRIEFEPLLTPQEAVFCTWTRFTGLALVASCALAIPLGILVVHVLVWLIPPARRTLNMAEAQVSNSFKVGLVSVGMVAFLAPVPLLGAGSSVCLSPSAIHYRAHTLAAPQIYDLSQIEAVRISCSIGKKGVWEARLIVAMRNGETFNLETFNLSMLRRRLSSSLPRIFDALQDRPWDHTGIEPDCPHELKKHFSYGR